MPHPGHRNPISSYHDSQRLIKLSKKHVAVVLSNDEVLLRNVNRICTQGKENMIQNALQTSGAVENDIMMWKFSDSFKATCTTTWNQRYQKIVDFLLFFALFPLSNMDENGIWCS